MNYRVSKFKNTVTPLCSYCKSSNETISHLYYLCNNVKTLWKQLTDWLNTFSVKIELSLTSVIFVQINEHASSFKNCLVLWNNNFIW